MSARALAIKSIKWRFQNPATIVMALIQPLIWLLLFSRMFPMNTAENYTAFVLPGVLVMSILSGAGISGIANYSLKRAGNYYRMYTSPVKRSSIIWGHVIDSMVIGVIEIFVLFVIAFIFGVRIASSIPGTLLMMIILLTTMAVSCLSYAASFLFQDENSFIALINILMLPLFFLSSALLSIDQVSSLFQFFIKLNPLTYIIDVLRVLILESTIAWTQVLFILGSLLIVCTLTFILAKHTLQRDQIK